MTEENFDLLKEIKDRFKEAYDAADEQYSDALDDLRFLNGEQWPVELKRDRESDGRPCLVISKIPTFADQVVGDIRMNEPSIKVKPVDSEADPETAEMLTGLIRNIEMQSDAEIAYDTAAESAVFCGVGAFRVTTEYADDDTFDQDIRIKRIKNPFTVYWDPAAQEWDRSDARFCFVTERLPKEEFERQYPKASNMAFEGGKDKDPFWGDDKNVRVVEYFKKVPDKKTLYLIRSDYGEQMVVDFRPDPADGWVVEREREVEGYKIQWWKANQSEILEGPTDWPSKYIPIVMVWGKELNIEGRSHYRGVTRNSKDSQRLYNYARSMSAEVISLAPKSPYLVTPKMIANYQGQWDTAHKRNYPYLAYEMDSDNPQAMPKREQPIGLNTGIQAEVMTADQELHDTTGLQQASLGKASNEKSGRAILARQREGDVGNFAYYDNLGRGLKYLGRILVDLIPKIFDTARIVRILGEDGKDEFVPVNQPFVQDNKQKLYDLTVGKYDVVVTIGPSYTTQREEAAENLLAFLKIAPNLAPMVADLLVKNMDWPGASELEKRFKAMLPPQITGEQPEGPPPVPDPAAQVELRGKMADVQSKELDVRQKFRQVRREEMGLEAEGGEE